MYNNEKSCITINCGCCGNNSKSYPILWQDKNGWNEGSITIPEIDLWEQIGVYISLSNNGTSYQCMVPFSKVDDGEVRSFVGGIVSQNGMVRSGGIDFTKDTLTYLDIQQCQINSSLYIDSKRKIFKIIGLIKSSQIG